MQRLSVEKVSQVITERPAISHKGNYGRVCLIGGNDQYGGAIMLCSEAAVHSGAGLVTTVTAQTNHAALHSRLPEAMVLAWQQTEQIKESIRQATVVVIGPGLGLAEESLLLLELTLGLLREKQVCIIDGSAITLVAQHQLRLPKGPIFILTPHEKEWERLSGLAIDEQKVEANQLVSQQIGGILVLKKHRTEVYSEHQVWQNSRGTPAMATGGMGDTLAGMIAGFTAQFPSVIDATLAAVYLHSHIGETLGESRYVVLPSEVIRAISGAMKKFESIS